MCLLNKMCRATVISPVHLFNRSMYLKSSQQTEISHAYRQKERKKGIHKRKAADSSAYSYFAVFLKVRQRTVLKPIGNTRAADGLLPDARDHL